MDLEERIKLRQNNLDTMFNPRTIAVVGASRRKDSIGRAILKNIINFDFKGTVYPVNPHADSILSIKAYPSISAIDDSIDLVIVVVPAKYVLGVIKEAAALDVKAAVIISAGFKEIGPRGATLEKELVGLANSANMRLIGPNCMGMFNAYDNQINATFAPRPPLKGKIGFISQSGALGVVVLDYATDQQLGFSKFVSLGNKADINSPDMLQNLGDDPNTEVILAYLESFNNPWDLKEIATRVSRKKPIILVKSGRTERGAQAAVSHTGGMMTEEKTLNAVLSRSGIIRVDNVEQLFDVASAFLKLDLPRGDRVAIITNAGGPSTLAVDALISQGMEIADLSVITLDILEENLPEEASWVNPVDLLASAGPKEYKLGLDALLEDPNVDSIIVIFVPPLMIQSREIAEVINQAAMKKVKPVLGVIMDNSEFMKEDLAFPMYTFPESAVMALDKLTEYAMWRKKPVEKYVNFPVDDEIRRIVPDAKKAGQDKLTHSQILDLFTGYGFKFPRTIIIGTYAEFTDFIQSDIEFPVVMKMDTKLVEHKTDKKGVLLDIRTVEELNECYASILGIYTELNIPVDEQRVMIQKYYPEGVEIALGVAVDEQFGPILLAGSGGILVEILEDVTFEAVPVNLERAKAMIKRLKCYPLLLGFRGADPIDLKQLEESILRLSQLASENRDIIELDINPLLMLGKGQKPVILDARASLTRLD